jgi:hypothetical protein
MRLSIAAAVLFAAVVAPCPARWLAHLQSQEDK